MEIHTSDNFWQAFALSGDPMAYLDYTQSSKNKPEKVRKSENYKSARIGN
jgi:hypothetical protein